MDILEEKTELSNPPASGQEKTDTFQLGEIVTVAAAHGAHDTFFSFLPTILPLLIKNLALNTTQAGLLSACTQIPNLLQPFIGHLADRKNLKMLVILAPTLSGVFITLVGVAPSFGLAAALLLLAGFSTAGFHSISPAMVSARSGQKVGRGMGFFMMGGELGFGVGPLVIVAAIGFLTLQGMPWLMTLGMLASVILYFRLKNVTTVTTRPHQAETRLPVGETLRQMRGLILPIMAILFITGFLNANIANYLPTFMTNEGAAFALAGISLSIVQLGCTIGVLVMGLVSDRLGLRSIALLGTLVSVFFSLGFLLTTGWIQMVLLVGVGFSSSMANPAYLSMIQTRYTQNRSLANGIYMSSSFVLRSIVVVLVGALADHFGMRPVFFGSALAALLALPLIFLLPER